MIKHIIHIADIHIPQDEKKRPFRELIKNMLGTILDEMEGIEPSETRIVIVGDTFDQKIKATNEAKSMFHEMLNFLNQMAKTYIIAGNHDMLENNPEKMDSITPTFEIADAYPNITYLDKELEYKSGFYEDENVIFALFSMHDNFASPGDIVEIKKEHPNSTIIGLYHGDIAGSVTDVGRVSESGIDTDNFIGCDCVMAGHIHKFQEIKKNGIPIVYPSSVFQKDAGENTTMHGFVKWSLEDLSFKHISVNNEYKIYKFEISSYDDISNDNEKLVNL